MYCSCSALFCLMYNIFQLLIDVNLVIGKWWPGIGPSPVPQWSLPPQCHKLFTPPNWRKRRMSQGLRLKVPIQLHNQEPFRDLLACHLYYILQSFKAIFSLLLDFSHYWKWESIFNIMAYCALLSDRETRFLKFKRWKLPWKNFWLFLKSFRSDFRFSQILKMCCFWV